MWSPRVYRYCLMMALCLGGLMPWAAAQGLTPEEQRIRQQLEKDYPFYLKLLEETVNINSGSLNVEGVKAVGAVMAREYEKIGFTTEWVSQPDSLKRAGHLVAYKKGKQGKKLFLIGHLDTVFEPDMEANPFRRLTDSTATGQGVVDMKGGNIIMLAACATLAKLGLLDDATIVNYFTGDEEKTGIPYSVSRADFIARARECDIALGFEGAQGLNNVATGRRGYSEWRLEVKGKQAHSAGIFSQNTGYGAIFETARVLNTCREQLSGEKYLTFNPGLLAGGSEMHMNDAALQASVSGKNNIVAPTAVVHGDLRFLSEAQRDHARQRMQAIARAHLPGTESEFSFTGGFPAMEPKPGNDSLVAMVSRISLAMGLGPTLAGDPGSRGAGDISWVSPYVDCLDGLGASGGGAHAPGEIINLREFPLLMQRATLLIYRLTRAGME